MTKIDTSTIVPIIVEIDGEEFPVASKTIETADKLIAAQESAEGLAAYHLWLAELRVLLGSNAVEKLFHSGSKENIDRIHRIHAGVLQAFEHHAIQTEMQIMDTRTEMVDKLTGFLSSFVSKLEELSKA